MKSAPPYNEFLTEVRAEMDQCGGHSELIQEFVDLVTAFSKPTLKLPSGSVTPETARN